ncbi:MAG TPA: DUF4388 domain-containing protein [Polyangia bacterium]|jgi:hypothetical protein|nr:DUF4388 domain-containing protein [Polyangia bacterium]
MSSGASRELGTVAVTSEPAVGFHAQLHGASLWDLVQMECLARSRRVVEVTGEGGVGYLYFDAGRVVHASTLRNRGKLAAFEILGWTHGTFQASHRSWPSTPTIEMSPESLLLHAAKQHDEQGASNLVAFPARGGDAAGELLEEIELLEIGEDDDTLARGPETGEEGEMSMRTPNTDETPIPPSAPRAENAADFPVMVRLSSNGAVLRNKGGTEELAEATAYAHRLVQLTGELLGLEEFVSLECTFANERFIVFTEGDGDIVALRPRPDLNLQALRERLGL